MKVKNLVIKEEEYMGHKFNTLYLILENGQEFKIGTLKESTNCNFVNCVHKEFKKN